MTDFKGWISPGGGLPISSEGLDHLFAEAVLAADTDVSWAAYFDDMRAAKAELESSRPPEDVSRTVELQGGIIIPVMSAGVLRLFARDIRKERQAFERQFGI